MLSKRPPRSLEDLPDGACFRRLGIRDLNFGFALYGSRGSVPLSQPARKPTATAVPRALRPARAFIPAIRAGRHPVTFAVVANMATRGFVALYRTSPGGLESGTRTAEGYRYSR